MGRAGVRDAERSARVSGAGGVVAAQVDPNHARGSRGRGEFEERATDRQRREPRG